jgi:hypothetical protein
VGNFTPKTQESNIPAWYINAPVNNSLFIYGEGEAFTFSDAKDNSLNSMASKLVVSVGSTILSTTKTSQNTQENTYSKDVTKDLRIDVQKIKFTNATVEKSEKIGEHFYVLMKVDRQELFKNKKVEFDINDNRLTKKFNSSKQYSKLEQIYILQNMYPDIKRAKSKAIILNAINNDFNHAFYVAKYDSYIDKISELKNELTIMVKSNNTKKYFADSLIDMLNQQQYKVSDSLKNDVIIYLNNKVKYSIARGWNIAKVTTTISVMSNNKIISNQVLNTIGRSSTSEESALENASWHFRKKIEEKTLDKVIFNK